MNTDQIISIGDRVNYYIDSKSVGINKIILVEYGWGYNLMEIPEHKQNVIINQPKDLCLAIKSFDNK